MHRMLRIFAGAVFEGATRTPCERQSPSVRLDEPCRIDAWGRPGGVERDRTVAPSAPSPTVLSERHIPCRVMLTIREVANLVNVLQAVAFVTRLSDPVVQRIAEIVITGLTIPATLVSFHRRRTGWRFCGGPLMFDAFVALMLVAEPVLVIEFRSPQDSRCSFPS